MSEPSKVSYRVLEPVRTGAIAQHVDADSRADDGAGVLLPLDSVTLAVDPGRVKRKRSRCSYLGRFA